MSNFYSFDLDRDKFDASNMYDIVKNPQSIKKPNNNGHEGKEVLSIKERGERLRDSSLDQTRSQPLCQKRNQSFN